MPLRSNFGTIPEVGKNPKSPLQAIFIRRLTEEMTRAGISQNQMARYAKQLGLGLSQRAVSGILAGENDPTLSKVFAIGQVLSLPPTALLTLGSGQERLGSPQTNVVPMALPPYPPILGKRLEAPKGAKRRRRR